MDSSATGTPTSVRGWHATFSKRRAALPVTDCQSYTPACPASQGHFLCSPYVHPTLPRWLPDLELIGLAIGGTRLRLKFWREGDLSRWEVLQQEGGPEIQVTEEPWSPWPSL